MTPVRVTVTTQAGDWRRIAVRCQCADVGRYAAAWEDVEAVIEELHQQHHREAPTCQHPWMRQAPTGARP